MNHSAEWIELTSEVPCYSARFVYPFAKVLSTYECFSVKYLNKLKAIDPATRIPAVIANRHAVRLVQWTGDADLGLKAGRSMHLGGAGALGYAMHCAATVREAIELATQYTRLVSDLLHVRHEAEGDRATICIDVGPAPRPVTDFVMSAWFTNHIREPLDGDAGLLCWFGHPKPSDTTEYERTFGRAGLRFDAPCYAFSFDRAYLDAPLVSADPVLNALLCKHVALTLSELCANRRFSGRVREIAMRELRYGAPKITRVAGQLRMSARTLSRRLEAEGTTFKAQRDHLRHELALLYVGSHGITLAEIAWRLRFSHVEGFYRAFKRWTGLTPRAYRFSQESRGRHGGKVDLRGRCTGTMVPVHRSRRTSR